MAEIPDPVVRVEISQTWKTIIAITVLLFNGALIAMLVWKGDGNNSLHSSALLWAFVSSLGVLAGIGLGSVIENIPGITFKK